MSRKNIFIDGETGTTGLLIRDRLSERKEFNIISLEHQFRKDISAKRDAVNQSDVVILCLPEDASRQSVSLIENKNTRVIDTSIAFRTDESWVYGFPEYTSGHRKKIKDADRVSNPGCYACGAIAILHPLVESGLMDKTTSISINAVSGYSGGGKKLISSFEEPKGEKNNVSFYHYGLGLDHKHLEEIRVRSGLEKHPIFVPSVGKFFRGMTVSIPLYIDSLSTGSSLRGIHETLKKFYLNEKFVTVKSLEESSDSRSCLNPESLNTTNIMKIFVFGNQEKKQLVVSAVFDNLGKGASGQAIQCLNIMLDTEESAGL